MRIFAGIMKEELTTAMHSEFTVSPEKEREHNVWVAMNQSENPKDLRAICESWGISIEDFNKYCKTYPGEHKLKTKGLQ